MWGEWRGCWLGFDLGACQHGEPAVRLLDGRRDSGCPSGEARRDRCGAGRGVESMSRAPWVLPKTERPFPMKNLELVNTALGWRLINERMPAEWTVSLGEATEQLREKYGVSRIRQDEFAARSHRLALEAWDAGKYEGLTVEVPGADLTRDETLRQGVSAESLANLSPVFRKEGGTVTAGNASPLNDGASAAWIGSRAAWGEAGPEASGSHRLLGRGCQRAPVLRLCACRGLEQGVGARHLTWDRVDAVELNEAFAAQSVACIDAWGIDPEIVNAWGGAVAIGHPLGASGTRCLSTLAARMQADGQRWGVATLCIGVGQGLAVVLENVDAEGE